MKPDNDELRMLRKMIEDLVAWHTTTPPAQVIQCADDIMKHLQSHHNKLLSDLVGELPEKRKTMPSNIWEGEAKKIANQAMCIGYNQCVDNVTALLMGRITK